jgi:hypothetical protein
MIEKGRAVTIENAISILTFPAPREEFTPAPKDLF